MKEKFEGHIGEEEEGEESFGSVKINGGKLEVGSIAYFYLDQYDKTIKDCNKAIEIYPNLKEAIELREKARKKLLEQHTPTPLGFEAIFAIVGFLMVAYVLRRRNK